MSAPAPSPNPTQAFNNAPAGLATKFDPWRVVVRSRWGRGQPFEPPSSWVKRPWHKVYRLKDDDLTMSGKVKIADAECWISYQIEIHYQPNFEFAKDWFRHHDELPASILNEYSAGFTAVAREELSRLTSTQVLLENELLAAQGRIATAIASGIMAKGITCDVYCRFDRPVIEWPAQDPDKPQPLPTGQDFYRKVKEQNTAFFLEQDDIRNRDNAKKEQQADTNAKEVADRAAARRKAETDALSQENRDALERRALVDGHAEQIRKKDAEKEQAELNFKRDQRIRVMNAEKELRQHRIGLRQTDEDFIQCEKDLLAKDNERARMEAQLKHATAEVSGEVETRLTRERISAEHIVEIEREREILKALPNLLERLSANASKIEQLRVVQLDGANEKPRPLPNSAAYSIAEGLSVIREFLSFLKE